MGAPTQCNPRELKVDRGRQGEARFTPRAGDSFVIRSREDRSIDVRVERK